MKKKLKIKIIPFCISILAVLLITGGIFAYTYFEYSGTKKKFLDVFLSAGETQNIPTKDYLDKVINLQYDAYQLSPGNLSYRDVTTKKPYTEELNNDVLNGSVTNYYKNGVMHIAGYFDVAMYATVLESTDTEGKVSYNISYTFYFFNINHNYMNKTASSEIEPSDYIRVAFVEGVDSRTEEEYEDNEEHLGDLKLAEDLDYIENTSNAGATTCGATSYQFVYGSGSNSFIYYEIVDWGAQTPWGDDTSVYVYSSSLYGDINNNYLDDMDSTTFSIFILESDGKVNNLVEGTISDLKTGEELIESEQATKGYADEYTKIPSYFKSTWTVTIGFSAGALVISLFLAALFNMIWIDLPNDNNQINKKQPKKAKK